MNEAAIGSEVAEGRRHGSLDYYYNASQLRLDTWHDVKDDSLRLAERHQRGTDVSPLLASLREDLSLLEMIEFYTAFPSKQDVRHLWRLLDTRQYQALARAVARLVRALVSHSYRRRRIDITQPEEEDLEEERDALAEHREHTFLAARPYFEVLIVDELSTLEEGAIRDGFARVRRPEDRFVYDTVVVPSFEDALIAMLLNSNIQAVIVRYGFPFRSQNDLEILRRHLGDLDETALEELTDDERSILLGKKIEEMRPELDLYLVTDAAVERTAGRATDHFKRTFYREMDYLEQHLSILRGVGQRYETPFFTALTEYSRQPTGVFHAMPISRGKSVLKSHWIQDMARFYGTNIFLAETSATSGGLDSLLQPTGPIKKAQELAARAFGARQTFFVTNGTSTANKIVVQALIKPGDIVLVDRDCHKSHHYGMVLAGARVSYLDSYPLDEYSMYGAVPLKTIKGRLLEYRRAGELDRVKMLLLTNCTFDGVVYDVERVMQECLAIKANLVFLWDEAWFAFAGFSPTYRERTAMRSAAQIRKRMRSPAYRERYQQWRAGFDESDDAAWLEQRLLPDPERTRVRAYATQSTHKTLTSLRQGSMIHVYDQDFRQSAEQAFHEAYMTHTSTSPNYQILASLDIGRRQVELEGFELVQKQVELAMALREQIASSERILRHFRLLVTRDLIPEEFRPSGVERYFDPERGWQNNMAKAWAEDEFVVDPTRLTLYLGSTGIDGNTFKNKYLMDKFGIQINKTSRNTVLFMTNIGTTRSSVAYLINVLVNIAKELDYHLEEMSPIERRIRERRVESLTVDVPPLPDFSHFHPAFTSGACGDGDLRSAYFLAHDDSACDYLTLDAEGVEAEMKGGRAVVSANFVIPYPPGFPILVPGQVLSEEILEFLGKLDVKEIHGFRPELGLRVFTEDALRAAAGEAALEEEAIRP